MNHFAAVWALMSGKTVVDRVSLKILFTLLTPRWLVRKRLTDSRLYVHGDLKASAC